jgi:hypothetical protein
MVLTDLLLRDANPVARRFFNTLAEEPETVAVAIVPQIRAVQVSAGICGSLQAVGLAGTSLPLKRSAQPCTPGQ